jgi:hypothetical protein
MSVQIIENWSEVKGVVRSCRPSPDVTGYVELELEVEQINPVEGFANLLGDRVGEKLVVLVPDELINSLRIVPGSLITCWVRRANLDRNFVHRQHISVHGPA